MKRRLLVLVSVLGLMGGTLAATSGVANAWYPPGKHITVSAHPTFVAPGGTVTAVAHRVPKGCSVQFTLGSDTETVAAKGHVAQVKLTAPFSTGWATVTATTVGCAFHQTATTKVFVGSPHVDAPANVEHGKPFNVQASGFPANHKITFFISMHGKTVASVKTTTDSHGRAHAGFTLSKKGSYLAVAVSDGVAAADAFHVTK